jgi:hypothetical protein
VDTLIKKLQDYAENKGLKIQGDPVLLRYQGPMVPPIFRKHDVMLEIKF